MVQDPDPLLLDREAASQEVHEYLGRVLDVLRDQVAYMSHWITRLTTREGAKEIEDAVVVGALMKHGFMMLNSAEALCRHGLGLAAYLQGRSFFESSVYIAWILKDNSREKARAYYTWDLRNERSWNSRAIPGSKERERFLKVIEPHRDAMNLDEDALERAGRARIKEIDAHLNKPAFKKLNRKYDKLKKRNAWYAAIGLNTFRDVCEALDRLPEYELFYSPASNIAHASSMREQVIQQKGYMALKPITSTPIVRDLLHYLIPMASGLLRNVITHYEPDELRSFRERYLERWRQPFVDMPMITEEVGFADPES